MNESRIKAKRTVYGVHCKTTRIARELTGDHRNVTRGNVFFQPPFCLRLVPAYRTPEVTAFRTEVANEVRRQRRGTR